MINSLFKATTLRYSSLPVFLADTRDKLNFHAYFLPCPPSEWSRIVKYQTPLRMSLRCEHNGTIVVFLLLSKIQFSTIIAN